MSSVDPVWLEPRRRGHPAVPHKPGRGGPDASPHAPSAGGPGGPVTLTHTLPWSPRLRSQARAYGLGPGRKYLGNVYLQTRAVCVGPEGPGPMTPVQSGGHAGEEGLLDVPGGGGAVNPGPSVQRAGEGHLRALGRVCLLGLHPSPLPWASHSSLVTSWAPPQSCLLHDQDGVQSASGEGLTQLLLGRRKLWVHMWVCECAGRCAGITVGAGTQPHLYMHVHTHVGPMHASMQAWACVQAGEPPMCPCECACMSSSRCLWTSVTTWIFTRVRSDVPTRAHAHVYAYVCAGQERGCHQALGSGPGGPSTRGWSL